MGLISRVSSRTYRYLEVSRKNMKINLKSGSSSQKELEIEESAAVKDFRSAVAKAFSVEPSQIVLIFAGKILKDDQSLSESKIVDGVSVHVVVKKGQSSTPTASSSKKEQPAQTPQAPAAQPATNTTSNTANPISGMSGLLNSSNLQQASQEMMRNPELMQKMMNSNPQTRALMDSNPEIREMMSNPSVLRDAMRMASNPAAMQEMIRHQDRAMQNIEGIPGGFNHLRRLHEEVAEPLQNAFGGQNTFQENNQN